MKQIRVAIPLILVSLSTRCLGAADDVALRRIAESRRMFDLRRELEQTNADRGDTRYYRALIEARFGREEAAVRHLRELLAERPDNGIKRRVHEELANALLWLGRYKDAAAEWAQVLQLMRAEDPEREQTSTWWNVCSALKDVTAQSVQFGPDTELTARFNKLGLWSLPVEASGKKAQWIIDTGMTFSTVTESEAKRVGLEELRDSDSRGGSGHTGKEVPFRLAVASDLRIGSAHLRNVVFVIVPDRALQFGSSSLPGVVGLPVIRALGSMALFPRGVVRIHANSTRLPGDPNIFFDGLTSIVEVRHAGHTASLKLDTGGDKTYLYSLFRDRFTPEERATLQRRREGFTGVGGSAEAETEVAPRLELELSGKIVILREIKLRMNALPDEGPSEGLLGMDVLRRGFTVDFATMRLALN